MRLIRVLAVLYSLLIAGWLLSHFWPPATEMMLDAMLGFALQLATAALLWLAAYRQPIARPFWRLLAAAWTVNLVGSIAWGVYEAATGRGLPFVSAIDLFYLARYALVLAAFGWCLVPWTDRRWIGLAGILLLAAAVTGLGLFWPVLASTSTTLFIFLAGAVYPLLDTVLVGLIGWAWLRTAAGRLRNAIAILLLSAIAYGAANWINLSVRIPSPEASSALAAFLWALADILASLAALYILWRKPAPVES
jgi:hypothetical protein